MAEWVDLGMQGAIVGTINLDDAIRIVNVIRSNTPGRLQTIRNEGWTGNERVILPAKAATF
jgi:hypothetical protein